MTIKWIVQIAEDDNKMIKIINFISKTKPYKVVHRL